MLGFLAVGCRSVFFVTPFSQSPFLTCYAKTVVCWLFAASVKWCLPVKYSSLVQGDNSQKFSVHMMLIGFIFYYGIIRFYIKNSVLMPCDIGINSHRNDSATAL